METNSPVLFVGALFVLSRVISHVSESDFFHICKTSISKVTTQRTKSKECASSVHHNGTLIQYIVTNELQLLGLTLTFFQQVLVHIDLDYFHLQSHDQLVGSDDDNSIEQWRGTSAASVHVAELTVGGTSSHGIILRY